MLSLFPREHCHFLDIDALCGGDIVFLTALEGDRVIGTGALALREGYGELKSMFTDPAARGKGAAAAIIRALEDEARARGLAWLRLETGGGLDAAHRLYVREGFAVCGPFGEYEESPHSVFMEKRLSP
ncbi:MAG: GNAT family N-acetyltransferase [Shimia sp.]